MADRIMNCELCVRKLHPLDSHVGYIEGVLVCVHIECWNEYYKDEIAKEKSEDLLEGQANGNA